MKVYIDTCSLNRIFDNQSQPRIYMESSSMLIIFMLIDAKAIEFVSSDVLSFENSGNPYEERLEFVKLCLQSASRIQSLDENILKRAEEIEQFQIKGLDALHLACAEKLKATYFITCDDTIIKRYKGAVTVQNPVDFISDVFKKEKSNDN